MTKLALRLGALAVLLVCAPLPLHADIFISELCDPRLNYATDRFLEIYNPDDQAVDLAGWQLVAVANGVDVFTWNLSGLIDAGEALVAGDATTIDVFPVDFADEAWSSATGNWNGKVGDGARLVDPLGTVTDYVVATGTAFENCDYVRNPDVSAPSPVYLPSEWTATPVDLPSQASPGTHETETPLPGPTILAIRTDPAWPSAGDAVHVLADVTDAAANITLVGVDWGTIPTALGNQITMANVGGDSYQTVSPIPAQGAGTTVYYRVQASNDLPATTAGDLHSYALAYTLTIHEIQGEAESSPYDGATATTQGVVTAVYGTTFVLQDGSGPWSGLWVRGTVAPAEGDLLTVTGLVTENDGPGNLGNTMLVEAKVILSMPGSVLPEALELTTVAVGTEPYEGVLVRVTEAVCTDPDLGSGEWEVDDGSGAGRIGAQGVVAVPTLGSTYEVTGPVGYSWDQYKLEPRDAEDVLWTADHSAPELFRVVPLGETTLRVVFSEAVDPVSAALDGNYAIPGLFVYAASREGGHPDQVLLATFPMLTGDYTLTVTGVADLFGNVTGGTSVDFHYANPGYPPGYYDATAGLSGEDLQAALHDIIKNHVARSYDYAWTAYFTTDVRPDNAMLWDIYSDIPGGIPPYLYVIGVDQGGVGGEEGTGYSREHTWCKSWFGGEVSPMYTDLFALYPTDTHMNGTRGAYAYGETVAPTFVSLNGSKLGPSSVVGYTGTIFEPRDDFKGDLARVYFYFSTRYYTEDAGWPGGPATDGAVVKPWALSMFLQWNDEDPVSQKEIDRNNAVYLIQQNRNPYVDRPEFVELVFQPPVVAVDEAPTPTRTRLYPASPNPFNPRTTLEYELAVPSSLELNVYDIRGRIVRHLVPKTLQPSGPHAVVWDGRSDDGRVLPSGIYFARLKTEEFAHTVKMTLLK